MVGFVHRIAKGGSYCFIRVTAAEEYFAHKSNFSDPAVFKQGQRVQFDVADAKPRPVATNVVAIELNNKAA